MGLSNSTKLKGLYTYGNELISPEGSLVVADNVNIDEPSIITPRRGFEDIGSLNNDSTEKVKQILAYKKTPLRHIEDRVEFLRESEFIPFSGSYNQVDPDIRIKFTEGNGNLYFTTDSGIKKISAKTASQFSEASGYITDSGVPKALDCFASIKFSDNGFLPPESKVAYKILFGKKDVNNNLSLGTPSARFVVVNSSSDSYTYEKTYLEFKIDENYQTQRTTITCGIVSNTLQTTTINDSMIKLTSADNVNKYVFWFNKGSGVAPSIVGYTAIQVDLTGASAGDNVAPFLNSAALGAGLTGIDVSLSGTDVIFTNTDPGLSDGATTPTGVIITDIGAGWVRTVNTVGTDSNYIKKYFLVHTIDKSFCFYYGNSQTIENVPSDPSLLGMTFAGIEISNSSVKSFIANKTSQSLQEALSSYFTVELNNSGSNPIVTITDVTGGDIDDAEQGTILVTTLGIVVITQGSISEGRNANAEVSFTVPFGVDNTFFYQIYRTAFQTVTDGLTLNDIDPGEIAYLVYEAPVTSTQGTKITIEDITPDTFRASGTPLYNNPGYDSNILQTNDQAPIAKDICNYQTFTFYANTKVFHRMNIDVIGMDSFVNEASKFVITNQDKTSIYTFRGTPVSTEITCADKQNTDIHKVANPDAKIIMYSASDETRYVLYFDDGTATTPDEPESILIRVDISDLDNTDNVATRTSIVLSQFSDFVISDVTGIGFTVTNSENGTATSIDTPNNDPSIDIGTGWSFNQVSAGTGEDDSNNYVLLSGSPSTALKIERTVRSLVNVINADIDSPVNAYYLSGLNDLPGKMLLESRNVEDAAFYVAVKDLDPDAFNPSLPEIPSASFTDVEASGIDTLLEYVNHTFQNEEEVFIYLPNVTPEISGIFKVEVVDDDHILINTPFGSGNVTDSFYFYPFEVSDNLAIPNRLYWSKSGQPEAVPLVNYLEVGTRDEPIERILSLRDYLFVLKTDGIFMLSGYSAPFTVRQLDTEKIDCPDSAVVLNNQIYMLSTNSVIVINESSPSIISRMIEDSILDVLKQESEYRSIGFGVSYDDDRAYLLWLPTIINDEVATQCFRYNIIERTWTRWTKTATCGGVVGKYPKLYIGDGDRAITMVERKNRDRTDHADKDFEISMSVLDSFINGKYRISDASEIEVGDVIIQTQYVNIDEYNSLLLKLDLDEGLNDKDYYTLECSTADNIASKLTALNAKLVADDSSGIITSHVFSNNDWVNMQEVYNELIAELNDNGSDTTFKDYSESEGTLPYEYIVSEVVRVDNEIKLSQSTSLILGDMTVYKQIKSLVETNPIHFGNPSSWKQISFGYLLFDQNNFYKMKLEYATDLSAYFEGRDFNGRGVGFWGYGDWGYQNKNYWGGDGNDAPRRVIIPRNKQRCRYISVRFSHSTARDFYKVDGVAHDVREFSSKAYK